MNKQWKPTGKERTLIRNAAVRECGMGRLKLEILVWHTIGDRSQTSVNQWLVSEDNDLYDNWPWADFVSGVPLDAEGRARIDFACHSKEQLESNVIVDYACGEIKSIKGACGNNLYLKGESP
jgi:hypothetical protein